MKRYLILLLPSALFPYVFLFFLFGFFRGFLLDWRKSAFALPVAWNLVLCVPVGKSGLFLVGIGKAMGGEILSAGQHGAEANSDSRLCDRLFAELHLRHNHLAVCLVIVLFFFDCLTILLTGLIGLAASIRCAVEKRVSKGLCIANGILSFVFCADVVLAIIFSIKSRRPVSQQPLYSKEDGFAVSLAGNTPSNKNSKLRKGE